GALRRRHGGSPFLGGCPLVDLEPLLVAVLDGALLPRPEHLGQRALARGVERRRDVGVDAAGPLEERRVLPADRRDARRLREDRTGLLVTEVGVGHVLEL